MELEVMKNSDHKIKNSIAIIPDFPKPGILFYDISTLIGDPLAWAETVNRMALRIKDLKPDVIFGIEARGFLVATAVASNLNIGMQMIRKKGKLPGETISLTYDLEYGVDTIEVQSDVITANQRIVILDDVLATGGTMQAAIDLLTMAKAEIICCATIIELPFLRGREKLRAKYHSLITYD